MGRMGKFAVGLSSLFLAACGPGDFLRNESQAQPPQPPQPALLWYETRANELTIMPLCEGKLSPPAEHTVHRRGVAVAQPCGMLSEELDASTIAREDFSKLFNARLSVRYTYADWNHVNARCTGYPEDCADPNKLELWAIESHNQAVLDWFQTQEQARIQHQANQQAAQEHQNQLARDQERREREREKRARRKAVLDEWAKPKPTVTCQTRDTFNGATTTCTEN